MKTRLDKQPFYHRFSLLSDTVPKCQASRKLHRRSTQQVKKRTEFSKEEEEEEEEEQEEQDQEQRSYLEQLQKEAFDELRVQLQHYNDEFISRMRYIEQTRDFLYKEEDDDDMQELQDCLNATSVKDYSQFIESCETKTSSDMFS